MSRTLRLTPEQYAALAQKRAKPSITALAPRPSKYRSRPVGGYASTKEAKRAAELKLLEKRGAIRDLHEQVRYELIPSQFVAGKCVERACSYVADFTYEEQNGEGIWLLVVEDCKGMRTKDYIIKRKLMLQVHGVRVRET